MLLEDDDRLFIGRVCRDERRERVRHRKTS
jgi:hypothetical protein